jgi:hypothetical protein
MSTPVYTTAGHDGKRIAGIGSGANSPEDQQGQEAQARQAHKLVCGALQTVHQDFG